MARGLMGTAADPSTDVVSVQGAAASPIPVNHAIGTQIVASSGNVANASGVATLAGAAGKTTYITGLYVTSTGATATSIQLITVTGLVSSGTLSFVLVVVAGVALPNTALTVNFTTPLPASAANTAIVVTVPALGAGNTNAVVNAYGYQL